MIPRFDAYTATVRGVEHGVLTSLAGRFMVSGDKTRTSQGYHGFEHKLAVKGDDGAEWVSVLWGGERHRDLVMCEVKGERTPEVVEAIRETLPGHNCTRSDSAADHDQPGLWETVLPVALRIKRDFHLRGEKRGDWDYPEDGRTLYLGAPTSAVRVRIYEKGKQPEYRHHQRPDWVRIECQVRPEKEAKRVYAAASAMQVWGASPYTRELAARVLELQVGSLPPYAARRQNERDRALAFMCQQYGAHLVSLKDDLGDWQSLGLTLGEIIKSNNLKRRR
jgi:hypothetical protein